VVQDVWFSAIKQGFDSPRGCQILKARAVLARAFCVTIATIMNRTLFVISVLSAVLGTAAGVGCRDGRPDDAGPVAPPLLGTRADESAAREFYPLSVGNSWVYHRDYNLVVEVIVGPPYKRVETFEGSVERRIEATEDIDGVVYFVEGTTLTPAGRPAGRTTFTLYRQDHSGLYVSDVRANGKAGAAARAPASAGVEARVAIGRSDRPNVRRALREHARKLDRIRASLAMAGRPILESPGRPGGLGPEEVLTLDYPLHTGATWFNRAQPFVVRSVVEARENLDLPAGRFPVWRVRVENELLDPEDRVVVWYGRSGRLAVSIHTETLALDTETGETALITSDENDVLRGLVLAPLP
jgi:hypothetical protein